MTDRLLVIEDGRVVQHGTPAQVARRPATQYVARLVGLNLYPGTLASADGTVRLAAGGSLTAAPDVPLPAVGTDVLVAVRPSAIALHTERPEHASPRNVWAGTITGLELLADRVRAQVDGQPGRPRRPHPRRRRRPRPPSGPAGVALREGDRGRRVPGAATTAGIRSGRSSPARRSPGYWRNHCRVTRLGIMRRNCPGHDVRCSSPRRPRWSAGAAPPALPTAVSVASAVAPGGRAAPGSRCRWPPCGVPRLASSGRRSGTREPGPHRGVARRPDPQPAPRSERSRGHPGAARRRGPRRAAPAEVGQGRGALAAEPAGRSWLPGLGAAPAADRPSSGVVRAAGDRGRPHDLAAHRPARPGARVPDQLRHPAPGGRGGRQVGARRDARRRGAAGAAVGRRAPSTGGAGPAAVDRQPGDDGHVVRRPALPVGRALGLRARLLRPDLARLPGPRHHDPARRSAGVTARHAGRPTPDPAT